MRIINAIKNGRLISIHLFLIFSSFGVAINATTGLAYSVIGFMILIFAVSKPKSKAEIVLFVLILFLGILDADFVVALNGESQFSYSINIARMALFLLVASFFRDFEFKHRLYLCYSFGLSAIASEIVVLFSPGMRQGLFINAKPIAEGFGFDFYRPTGLIGDPNYFSIPLTLMAVALLQSKKYFLFTFSLVPIMLGGSRSALVAVIISALYLLFFRSRTNIYKLLVSLCFVIVVVVTSLYVVNMMREGTTSESNEERIGLIYYGLERFTSFSYLSSTYGAPIGKALDGEHIVIHNFFLQTMCTSLLLAIILIYRIYRGFTIKEQIPILICLITEMMFLDMSSSNAVIFMLFVFSLPSLKKQECFLSVNLNPAKRCI